MQRSCEGRCKSALANVEGRYLPNASRRTQVAQLLAMSGAQRLLASVRFQWTLLQAFGLVACLLETSLGYESRPAIWVQTLARRRRSHPP